MVARSPISRIRYRNNAAVDSPSIAAATADMVVDLDVVTVPHFATRDERDAAYTDAIAGTGPYLVGGVATPQLGMLCTVGTYPAQSVITYMWDGDSWTPDLARRVTYDATKSFLSLPGSVDSALSFQSDGTGRFTTTPLGIIVAEAGVYTATLCVTASTAIEASKVGYGFIAANSAEARGYIPVGQVKGSCSLTGIIMSAGGTINTGFGHTNVGAQNLACRYQVTKISA